jgi:hypothetical protein
VLLLARALQTIRRAPRSRPALEERSRGKNRQAAQTLSECNVPRGRETATRRTFARDYLRGRILTFLGILLLRGLSGAFSGSESSATTSGARIGLAISRAKLTTSS